jgi:hypothetical protein
MALYVEITIAEKSVKSNQGYGPVVVTLSPTLEIRGSGSSRGWARE